MRKLAYFAAGFLCAVIVMVTVPIGAQPREVSALYGVIHLVVNGANFGTDTLLFNDRTYVPLRSISYAFGADVGYDPATRTATITTAERTVELHFEHFHNIPTFEFITGVRDINILEHNADRLWFTVSRNYASDYEFLQYIEALTVAGFTDEYGQDIGGNGTIVLSGHGVQIIVSMLGPSYTFSIVRI